MFPGHDPAERDVARPQSNDDEQFDGEDPARASEEPGSYTVVARRYRPQRFEDLVGQEHVVQALRNAIKLNRVTHAYLFSGTRGVGKTSMARIFAKCLNCVNGPTEEPCQTCDICQAIAAGQDIDVIEIDGASNNGVEAVRELRQNAGLRPSRARYKIYYIDEVHMLSTGAFNALLKILEEPPEHVKFFFATTEPNKIPITVLSRCQRYDFAGISPEQIVTTLLQICGREGVESDRDALRAVARRASGSMRDAQSLLEQLLSFGGPKLTVELVHQALGIAPDDRVLDMIDALADHESGKALRLLEDAVGSGVQPVDMLQGALEFLRDVMMATAGADVPPLAASPSQMDRLRSLAKRWNFDSVLAALQILSEARGKLRGSPHGRLIVELALCRVARLEDLAELGALVSRLASLEANGFTAAPSKKKLKAEEPPESLVAEPPISPAVVPPLAPKHDEPKRVRTLTIDDINGCWSDLILKVGPHLGAKLSQVPPTYIEPPDMVVIEVPPRYNWIAGECEAVEPRSKVEGIFSTLLGRPVRMRFQRVVGEETPAEKLPSAAAIGAQEVSSDPLVARLVELFEARKIRVEVDEDAATT